MVDGNGKKLRNHVYHAEAAALHGELKLPYSSKVERQAHAKVKPEGGYESQHGKPFRVEGVLSYCAAHTQVAGYEETEEKGRVYKTLATSEVEQLNILNVVTCERAVAQASTEHPRFEEDGHVPFPTFLGSQYHNLRIGGYPVEVELDIELLSQNEHSWNVPFSRHKPFLDRIADRLKHFRGESISKNLKDRYPVDAFIDKDKECVVFSLVKNIETKAPWFRRDSHVFDIPHFGQVHLAVLRIEYSEQQGDIVKPTLFDLKMFDLNMGCIGTGTLSAVMTSNNGGTGPPLSGGG